MSPTKNKPILYIITNNHFDPTWRGCWERQFPWNDQTFIKRIQINVRAWEIATMRLELDN